MILLQGGGKRGYSFRQRLPKSGFLPCWFVLPDAFSFPFVCIIQIDLRPLYPKKDLVHRMDIRKIKAVLFDFDGVIMDTERQYSLFWSRIGKEFLQMDDLDVRIKGQTLAYIFDTFFAGQAEKRAEITDALNRFERGMDYEYVPGVLDFVRSLTDKGVATAVVTSSNELKMAAVYKAHPEVKPMFGHILTADMFTRSKPAPDCYLLGMKVCGSTPETTLVFEDSVNGLKAGMAAGATVVGLATTHPREVVEPLCHYVIEDFKGFTLEKLNDVRQ